MFYRTLITSLEAWKKKSNRKPLILRGARQVGKTTLIDLFSRGFKQYISLNLDIRENVEIFENAGNIDELVDAIFLYHDGLKNEPETLIFIDEIQNSPAAVKWLRYFYEEKKQLYVIAAGSLLESLIQKQVSFPVGRVEYLPLRPFSFYEFLLAAGEEKSIQILQEIPFPEYAHNKLLGLFRKYLIIGGMPEIVGYYLETEDINALGPVYDSLIISYKDDVEKYASTSLQGTILRHSIDHIFLEAGKRIKFEGFGNSNYRSREMKEALLALESALLIQLIYPVTSVNQPLQPDQRKSPKLQVVDTGLINHVSGIKKELFGAKVLDSVYEGRIAEHIVGQELISLSESLLHREKFWIREKESDAEVDYLYTYDHLVVPVEVKSGGSGRLRSLHEFMDRSGHKYAVRIYSEKLDVTRSRTRNGKDYYLLNLPFYLVHRIEDYLGWLVNKYV
jgi:uncharacterized protein